MKTKIKRKWLKALRSGKYKKTTDILRDGNKFCCLGVLCDFYSQEKKIEWEDLGYWGNKTFLKEEHNLPIDVVKWSGLKEINPKIEMKGVLTSLEILNDSGMSFKKIADLISKKL